MFAAFLHDFGKSQIPKDILDSQKKFDRDGPEMKMILSHPAKGAELLKKMGMPTYAVNMAYYHHVKLNTFMKSSYPQGASYETSIMESRLLAIVDIYQALVGKRNYKKSWSPPSAIRYLDALAGVEFDPEIWNNFLQVTGKYPKSSLVELSDDSLGFVMNVPKEDLDRPQVAIVRNAAGEDLTRTPLIDLAVERNISIVKDLDAQDIFGEKCLNTFLNIKAV
jgi:HD-GYP domain-containing protein (c-di-GMP phosphodiesterase class II)